MKKYVLAKWFPTLPKILKNKTVLLEEKNGKYIIDPELYPNKKEYDTNNLKNIVFEKSLVEETDEFFKKSELFVNVLGEELCVECVKGLFYVTSPNTDDEVVAIKKVVADDFMDVDDLYFIVEDGKIVESVVVKTVDDAIDMAKILVKFNWDVKKVMEYYKSNKK